MQNLDEELDGRLAALAGRAPGGTVPPALRAAGRRRRRFALSLTMAPAIGLAAVATVAAGAAVVANIPREYPGIENAGQPLAGAQMECMTPPQAAAFLAAHGFTDVTWQVESGPGTKTGGLSVQRSTAPAHGYVIPGSLLEDGRVLMVVDQRDGANGVGACFGMPMP